MSKIEINTGTETNEDMIDTIQQIMQDIEAEGYTIQVVTFPGDDKITLTGSKSDLANFVCDECFRECFFNGASTKEVKAKIS